MRTYILIARHLGKVSGEKIYCHNKMAYLLSRGWRVLFVSCKEETVDVPDGSHYSHFVFPALAYAPECYSRREVRRTVEGIVRAVGDLGGGECVIESDSLNRAVWAEMVARRLNAVHLAFFLQERHHYDEEARRYLMFKYGRHELASITAKSINLILGDGVAARDDTKIKAFCNNCVRPCEDPVSGQLPQGAKYTFGSIGRLDKGCAPAILEGFKSFAALHPDEKINVVLIGGATGRNRVRQLRRLVKGCGNIHLTITGYLFPIPESLIEKIDLFVSTAGSTSCTYRFHRPTVRVHPVTGDPVGIVGLDDLTGKTMYDPMPGATIPGTIQRALSRASDIVYIYNRFEDYDEAMRREFDRQLGLAAAVRDRGYYDEGLLMRIRTTHIKGHAWHRLVGRLFGARALNLLVGLFKAVTGGV